MLEIRDLCISYNNCQVVKHVNLNVEENQIITIVGESGSGKSTLLHSILGLLGENGKVDSGNILFQGNDLLVCTQKELQDIRGNSISLVLQNPESTFDPSMRAGKQFFEAMKVHNSINYSDSIKIAIGLLKELQFDDPQRVLESYPFELSGGMCQRLAIAMALANKPQLILADEPTSALDVTIQSEIIQLLLRLHRKYMLSMLFVTHNMKIVPQIADLVGVMYQGELVEFGPTEQILSNPEHSYTKQLINAVPTLSHHDLTNIRA